MEEWASGLQAGMGRAAGNRACAVRRPAKIRGRALAPSCGISHKGQEKQERSADVLHMQGNLWYNLHCS